jgi:hypothetical protein
VCYRRRRRDEWERTVRAGIERARFRQGFPETGGDVGIGEKPMLWDVDIGGEGDEWTVSLTLQSPYPGCRAQGGCDRWIMS